MARTARRARSAPQFEDLEARSLLSVGTGPWVPQTPLNAATTVLLRFATGTPASAANADIGAVGGRVVKTFPDGPEVVALAPWSDTSAALAKLNADAGIVYADADQTIHAAGTVIPNDPGFSQQYGDDVIDAPDAWGITTGTSATIVAVLDTGVDLNSVDLDAHLWTNPANPSLHGYNFVNNNGNIQDLNGHGTNVTGILAGIGDNGVGIAGVDWNATIMPLKVLDNQGDGSTDDAVSGIYFAVQNGARVINASWGGGPFSQPLLDAINYANSQNVVFVTAAGNDSSNNDTTPTYPSSYRLPNELVVAATDQNDNLADFSNYGATSVDLAAPGVDILSTVPGGYAADTGTSMSTPFVAGVAALVIGQDPSLTATQVVSRIVSTVTPDPALNGLVASGGIVNAYFALLDHVTVASAGGGGGGGGGGTTTIPTVSLQTVESDILTTPDDFAQHGGTNAGYVAGVFQALFDRPATTTDLSYWSGLLQAGLSRTEMVQILQDTPEAQITMVARWYQFEVGSPDSLEALKDNPALTYWGTAFSGGESVAAAQSAILSSDSYYASRGGTDVGYVTGLFESVLGRDATGDDVTFWTTQLAAGLSRSQMVEDLLSSVEGHRTSVARVYQFELGNTDSLESLKDNDGIQYWAALLGED